MKSGDLVKVRPAGWGVYLRRHALGSPELSDEHGSNRGEQIGAEDVLTVLEVNTFDPNGLDPDLSPVVDVRVLTPRGTVGYIARVRLESIR